ncbi:centromere protein J-like, partial [Scomber scombrus]|uniref:centromere protein J-like n=1 Tax=Scomber scombrus TaxID=13677 RepID=UPI002DDA2961
MKITHPPSVTSFPSSLHPPPPPSLSLGSHQLNPAEEYSPSQTDGLGGQKVLKQPRDLKPQKKNRLSSENKAARRWRGIHCQRAEQEDELERRHKERDCILCDREEAQVTRNQQSLSKLECEAMQALRQQLEALQQQFEHRETCWSVVEHQLETLSRENCELREKLTVRQQCCLLAGRCITPTHTDTQEQLEE